MRSLPALLATAALGAALLQSTAATAAGETCQGRPATLVGALDQQVSGTEGPDVIVSNGASRVDALGGDDLICITGTPITDANAARAVSLQAGAGNDRVEADTPGWGTVTTLGPGADTYTGSAVAAHEVRGNDIWWYSDLEPDTIRIAGGTATVYSGAQGQPNSDVVEIAGGVAQWTGYMTPAGRLDGGRASTLRVTAPSGDAMINAVRRTATTGTSSAAYSGFDQLEFATVAKKGTVTFRGTNDVEHLSVDAPDTYDRVIDMRGGRDTYSSNGFGSGRSAYVGGAGRDTLLLATPRLAVEADLDDGRFSAHEGKRTVRRTFREFEDLVLAAQEARVDGTPAADLIVVIACRTRVSADAGSDQVRLDARLTDWDMPRCSSRSSVVDGGRGDDRLVGADGRDRLLGGPGRDHADGRRGQDVCQAEETERCEARR